ncbi:N-acetyltransferase family protein [Pontixanthobacter sp.]|uniref:GNAT family N-acetyltransferase n=1 Tax=Pontixanthobacter sp. TaxID=2792078 RepID=UPI003C7E69D9
MSSTDKPVVHGHSRTFTVADLDAPTQPLLAVMVDLFQQGQTSHHAAFPAHFGPASDSAPIARYCRGFLKPRNPFRKRSGFAKGLFIDGVLAGHVLYRLNKGYNVFYGSPRWSCFIEDITITETARGTGGASALMEALLADMEALGQCVISGTVWNMNAASAALFTKHGFEPLSRAFHKVLP